jgi:DNA (cytosine-5)-methyltransferase 1
MKFIDFFAGIGGFRLGMEMAGHECVGHCEIDKYADKSYRAMHSVKESEWFANDITRVEPGELPEADCYCGGFPCQSFSIAGKRGGFQDTRGTLFFEVMRLAQIRKPKYLFLENVAGLLSHDGGSTFGTIIAAMGELGYDAEWQVLNSKHFGVPQNRERVFIIGHLGGGGGREVFPITGANSKALKELVGGSQGYRVYDPEGTSCTLASQAGGMGAKTGLYLMGATIDKPGGMESIQLKDIGKDMANCLVAREYKGIARSSNVIVQPVLTPDRAEKRQNGRRFKTDGEPMFTLTAQDRHGVVMWGGLQAHQTPRTDGISLCINSAAGMGGGQSPVLTQGARIRKLTPKECFRLQGFPDEYFERAAAVNSNSQLYKQAGNSVTVNVIYEIAKGLI